MLKVYIDRLTGEKTEKILESLPPSFIDVEESELTFPCPVEVKGEAYLANDHLVFHLDVETRVKMPCSICNEDLEHPLSLENFYHTESLEELKEPIFDLTPVLREALLVEVPHYVECKSICPNRHRVTPYIREEEEVYYPFSGIDKET